MLQDFCWYDDAFEKILPVELCLSVHLNLKVIYGKLGAGRAVELEICRKPQIAPSAGYPQCLEL